MLWWQEWSARRMLATLGWTILCVMIAMRKRRTAEPSPHRPSPEPLLCGQSSGAYCLPTSASSNTCLGATAGRGLQRGLAEAA